MDSLHNMPPAAPYGTINIAVAGLGRMGKRHAKTLLYRVPHARLVAVCSNDEKELAWAREFFKSDDKKAEIKVFGDYSEMLEHPGLQAVWVSTSTNVHAPQTLEAIAKGLHVLCEKPISQKLEEVRDRPSPFSL
jgi:myo-inositol 2-dehydrogenase/D-chiro-inositol 1-dehydrogenase